MGIGEPVLSASWINQGVGLGMALDGSERCVDCRQEVGCEARCLPMVPEVGVVNVELGLGVRRSRFTSAVAA